MNRFVGRPRRMEKVWFLDERSKSRSRRENQYWFWECVEMWRKMILTGGMVLVAPGSSAQVLWAEVVCLIYLLLVLKIAPFRYDLDDWLAFAASLQLFLVFMAAFALKTDDPNDTVYEKKTMGICLAILCCGVVLLNARFK